MRCLVAVTAFVTLLPTVAARASDGESFRIDDEAIRQRLATSEAPLAAADSVTRHSILTTDN